MLRTRLWMGTLLVLLVLGVLAIDDQFSPWYPILFVLTLLLSLGAGYELLTLLDDAWRPHAGLTLAGVAAVVTSNWVPHVLDRARAVEPSPWGWVAGTFALFVLSVLLWEMAVYREPGRSVVRLSLAVFTVGYVALLPSFFAQMRWLDDPPGWQGVLSRGTLALALAVFVPKFCDIGAYFTGRFLGRHKMTPVLSPKKTWEGLAGGLATAVLAATLIGRLGGEESSLAGVLRMGCLGLAVGVAGVLGDLAESLIKRDCGKKDASQVVPGFGGILDVVDSIVFTAPLVYWLVR